MTGTLHSQAALSGTTYRNKQARQDDRRSMHWLCQCGRRQATKARRMLRVQTPWNDTEPATHSLHRVSPPPSSAPEWVVGRRRPPVDLWMAPTPSGPMALEAIADRD